MKTFPTFLCAALSSLLCAQAPAAENVTFADVLAIPTTQATESVSYGPDQFQFGQLCLPANSPTRATLD